ncbi:MAG: hypothetical protein ISS26_06155 [Candidatus Omnitrophica bacterium]|nr:hypothetical protein [Candidatus Omnitrophota bacterium]
MERKIIRQIALVLSTAFTLVGCATVPDKAIRETSKHGQYEDTETVIMLDKKIRKFLYVVDQSESKTEDGRLAVSAKFINKTNGKLEAQVQTVFKDENGNMSDQTNWELILVPSGSHYYYKAASLNTKAKTYTIKCRSVLKERKSAL